MTYMKIMNSLRIQLSSLLLVFSLALAGLLLPVHSAYAMSESEVARFAEEQLGVTYGIHGPITQELVTLLAQKPYLVPLLNESLAAAAHINPDPKTNPAQDIASYLDFIDSAVELIPQEILDNPPDLIRDQILQSICYFYYLVDQEISWHDPAAFGSKLQYHPDFSPWLRDFVNAWGAYLDTEASFTDATYQQFYADPIFRLATGDYEDRALWTNFNRFFSRFLVDPSKRPVAGADDDSIVVAPADSVPQGVWPIDANGERPTWHDYSALMEAAQPLRDVADTAVADHALYYFTSGTTGDPKMTVHGHGYPLGHETTGRFWANAKPGKVIWNISDTGWAKAAWTSLFAPWLCGAAIFAFHKEGFDPDATLACLERYPISTLCAPPTAYRMFVRQNVSKHKFKTLERCVSAGEPLNPEVIDLWKTQTGMPIYEGNGQTETVVLCGSFDGMDVRPGSMGLPAPGIDLQVVDHDGQVCKPGEEGGIAVRVLPEAPMGMFLGYKDDPVRTAACFKGDWYLTGDRATRDADGYFWFVGRADDVILSSGYRIGPFEVESVLFEHEAVAESAVVASPDPVRGEVVKAFIVLAEGYKASEALVEELQAYAKKTTAPYKYPRKIEFVSQLPKTVSGKIKRNELKQQEWDLEASM